MITQKVNIGAASYNVHYDHYLHFWKTVSDRSWEPEMIGLMESMVGPTTLFFDIGTWMGPTALYAAALGAETYAFEPDPVAYRRFIRNLSLNPELRSLVTPFNAACGQEPGTITLYADALGNSETSILSTRNHVLEDKSKLNTVQADVLDLRALIASSYIRSREVFFKIDIEGAEFDLLPHIAPTIREMDRAIVNVSTHPANLKADNPEEQLKLRREAKLKILDPLSGLLWFEWDNGIMRSVTEADVRDRALNGLGEPDVFIAATYDVLALAEY